MKTPGQLHFKNDGLTQIFESIKGEKYIRHRELITSEWKEWVKLKTEQK